MASQTTEGGVWAPISGDVQRGVERYGDLVSQGVNYFPESTVSPQSQTTRAGTSALGGQAVGGQKDVLGQSNQAWNFATGDVLNPESNPFLQQSAQAALNPVMDRLMQQILPGIGQSAVQSGGFGGTAHANLKQNAISDAVKSGLDTTSQMYSNAYGQNLNAYMQALGMTPQMLTAQTAPATTQLAAGGLQDQYSQALLNDQINRFNFGQTSEMDLLDKYLRTTQGFPGSQTTTAESDSLWDSIF